MTPFRTDPPPTVPALLRWLIRRLAPVDWRESLLGDVEEEMRRLSRRGHAAVFVVTAGAVVTVARLRWDRRHDSRSPTARREGSLMHTLFAEARQALRSLLSRPASSVLALITLTVGIGVTTSVFSLANWLLFRPIPGIGAPESLVTLRYEMKGATYPASGPDVGDVTKARSLAAVAGFEKAALHVAHINGADPRRLDGEYVTTNYFDVLQQRLSAGRAFTAADEAAGPAAHVTVLSADFARATFGDPATAVGQQLLVDRVPFESSVSPARAIHGPSRTDTTQMWIPITSQEALRTNDRRISVFFTMLGRLRPGATGRASARSARRDPIR